MDKKGDDITSLIKKAIDASTKFEALMDSIDFNSYLPEEEEKAEIKKTNRYHAYRNMLKKAFKSCQDVVEEIPDEREEITLKESSDPKKLAPYLIYQLFKAKEIRLEGREQTTREDEKKKYIKAKYKLHKAFISIPLENFYGKVENRIYNKNNWAKVLYYNEMAICHSGLTESSMSLGYAEQSISILEELHPVLENIENMKVDNWRSKIETKGESLSFSLIIKLYTFALYNKGEAERLLHNDDSAMRTFRRITKIYKKWKTANRSDYYSALLRTALILTDMGRGNEALDALNKITVDKNNFQYVGRELERASVYIDQKEYGKAYKILEAFTDKNDYWRYTFAQRKAKVYLLRLLNEYKKNRRSEERRVGKECRSRWSPYH